MRWFGSGGRLPRRVMLRHCLALFGVLRGTAWAGQDRVFRDLARPVHVPLGEVAVPWQLAPFDARAVSISGAPLLLKGVVVRTAATPAGLQALCLTCPHEICYVNLVRDTTSVELDADRAPDHPLFVCPCHFSVFDPVADGARLAGPSPRGLFRFGLRVDGDSVRIDRVETALLRFFA